ncbi:MAG: head GIN domain-containing protein [Cyclobacteriaceae bacterium]
MIQTEERYTSFCLVLVLLLIAVCFSSCDDEKAYCFEGDGNLTESEMNIPAFQSIYVYDGLNVYLHQAEEQKVIIKAGKNIIHRISAEVNDGGLFLRDQNRCNWSRDYQEREVHIWTKDIHTIEQSGYGKIVSADTLKMPDLNLRAQGGPGNYELTLDCERVVVHSWRYGTIKLAGKTRQLVVKYLNNNAIFDGRDLQAEEIEIIHKSHNSFHLYPIKSLKGEIRARGHTYLYHEPELIQVEQKGQGEIIVK